MMPPFTPEQEARFAEIMAGWSKAVIEAVLDPNLAPDQTVHSGDWRKHAKLYRDDPHWSAKARATAERLKTLGRKKSDVS